MRSITAIALVCGALVWPIASRSACSAEFTPYLAPVCVSYRQATGELIVLGSHGRRIVIVDPLANTKRRTVTLPGPGSDLLVRGDNAYVSICQPKGVVLQIDLATGATLRQLAVGHSPTAMALSHNGEWLGVANRFDNSVDLLDLRRGKRLSIPVVREPVALAFLSDDQQLLVANHLPKVRPFLDDENPVIAAEVSLIDAAQKSLIKNIELPNGSQALRGMACSPDGRYVAITHILGNYTVPTMSIGRGAINRNVLSLIDTDRMQWIGTIALDDPDLGAANPWGVCFTDDSRQLLVTHAGTHELSVIDFVALIEHLQARDPGPKLFDSAGLTVMIGIRRRIPTGVIGPRSLLVHQRTAYVAGYFSDTLAAIPLGEPSRPASVMALDQPQPKPKARLGEQYFHDASLCRQHWQSCSTCHPDGRSDVLYWDLLNDGTGNTKNTKSLLMSALTPPVMWRGVRADASAAIRAGIHHIHFATPRQEQADAILQFLVEMPAVPGPSLNADVLESPKVEEASCAKCHYPGVPRGTLTPAARRGKKIFEGKAGCAACHPHPYFTSRQTVDPGLGAGVSYDVPSLVEVWRTAPYLHSGDALDLRQTITDFNFMHRRGTTQLLSPQELDDLIEYLRSL